MVSRFTSLIGAFALAYISLVFRLYDIQLTNGEQYRAKAESQAAARLQVADRGAIYFTYKNGSTEAAVSNKDMPLIFAVPNEIEDAQEAAYRLAPVLNSPADGLVASLAKKNDEYELLKKKADRKLAAEVDELGLKGIYVGEVAERSYSFGTLAAHLLGFVAPNSTDPGHSGKYGIEEFYNEQLAGAPGHGTGRDAVPPRPGERIMLTIEPNIQHETARVLEKVIERYNAKGGTVIVMDPKTGKILAMESSPHFDPNNYGRAEIADFLNPATQQIYEPGSVVKVLTMAAGIDTGKITPETTFNDAGVLNVSNKKIYNWDLKAHGTVTMTNVIEQSLNTGAAFAERQTGDAVFREYLLKFGFGDKTGVDLPGELKGDLRNLAPKAPPIEYAAASFGQGIAVTPLQMVNAIAAIANGGVLMRPYVNADLGPEEVRRVISEDTAKKVAKMMVSAVDKAKVARIGGYSIAGKTGTAQVADLVRGGYTGRYINTYVGFGPVSDPRFVILVKLVEPAGDVLAGQTVVPAFRDLAEFILNYYNMPPDRLVE